MVKAINNMFVRSKENAGEQFVRLNHRPGQSTLS
jgi:hypothetical protein